MYGWVLCGLLLYGLVTCRVSPRFLRKNLTVRVAHSGLPYFLRTEEFTHCPSLSGHANSPSQGEKRKERGAHKQRCGLLQDSF